MIKTTNEPLTMESLVEQFLNDYFAFYPTSASMLGLHEYDGRIIDFRPAAIQSRIETLHRYRRTLEEIDTHAMDKLTLFDYHLLCWQTNAELWHLTEECAHTRNPLFYTENIIVDDYMKRAYAPLDVRAAALARHLRQLPDAMMVARENLDAQIPRIFVEEAIPVFEGFIAFLTDNLNDAFSTLEDTALADELWAARDDAVAALEMFCTYLDHDLLPLAHAEFALGEEQFAKMLYYDELVDVPLETLLAVGEADLARNQAKLVALARTRDATKPIDAQLQELQRHHPDATMLLEETKNILDSIRDFVEAQDLVTLPDHALCYVEETPPYDRWAFAMMDADGPFEEVSTGSFFYITLPEPDWTSEQVESWMTKFDYATLTDTSIHETYPGHHVHFASIRSAPSRLAKVFRAYTHYEGWAHYVEQMMFDQGYGNDAPHLRMAQLTEALVRNCRYICAIKMHTQGMSVEEAIRFFMEHAYMDEVTATIEARRGTHDPGYINYTLGKLLLHKLLEQYKTAYGSAFSLKRFHDGCIGYGSPPIPILRKLMLPEDDGILL